MNNYIHLEKWVNHQEGPNALVLYGEGINCDRETAYALNKAGANPNVMHINELTKKSEVLNNYQILVVPGGFSYGDDLGSGLVFGKNLLKLGNKLKDFIEEGKAVIGICNGNQILTVAGLIPALQDIIGIQEVFMSNNTNARYTCLWNHLKIENQTPYLKNVKDLILPCAHGEGLYTMAQETLDTLIKNKQVVLRFTKPDGMPAKGQFPFSPNGSMYDIAAITNTKGNVFGIMPHPERFINMTQHPEYAFINEKSKRTKQPLPKEGSGLQIFKNIVDYAKNLSL
ncbi:MAG: phosphoribosylformylglycinamidine synthase I [Candidatus Nanoarchaeia archaeon]|jgi:phosphoribosylformylglycinamidine synthase